MSTSSVLTLGFGSFGNVNLLPTLGYGAGEPAEPDPGWLGGGAKDSEYHARKRQIEELDRINEQIRRDEHAAIKSLYRVEIPEEIKTPEIEKISLQDLQDIASLDLDIASLIGEINLVREHLLAQQKLEELLARELDDEAAFLLLLN